MSGAPLWRGLALVAPLGARVAGHLVDHVTGISIDSRSVQPGDLFFALRTESGDGHRFVDAAMEKGAAAAVVDETWDAAHPSRAPRFVVRDTLAAMEGLGRAARARSTARIVAVTGSVGKTSTKEALRLALGALGATHASVASYNNHWGVPLTLARMPEDTAFGVFEIGMNHAGEITPLTAMVRPHIAIVTTVAAVHMEAFDSVDDIAEAKAEIFSGVEEGGVAIINRDIDHYALLRQRAAASKAARIVSFGAHEEADAQLESFEPLPDGSLIHARIFGEAASYRLGAPGRHLAINSLAVIAATALCLGLPAREAAAPLALFTAPKGRGQQVRLQSRTGVFTLIDESYNANPASMRAALAVLGSYPLSVLGRRIAVLGDMLELGPDSARLHAALADDIDAQKIDLVFAAGAQSKHLFDALPAARRGAWRETAAEIEAPLIEAIHGGDAVMVKASNGSRMVPLVAALTEKLSPETASAN